MPAAAKDITWLIVAVVSTLVSAVISEVVSVVSQVVSVVSEVVGVVSQIVGVVSQVVCVVSQAVGVVSQAVVAEAVAAAAAVSVVRVEPMMLINWAGGQLHSVLGQASVLGVSIRGHTLDASHAEPVVVSTTVGVKVAGLGPSHSQQSSHTELHVEQRAGTECYS